MIRAFKISAACLAILLALTTSRALATDVVWKGITYHDAAITSAKGDRVTVEGTRDSDGEQATFEMPLSNVPDEVIQQYRLSRSGPGNAASSPLNPQR